MRHRLAYKIFLALGIALILFVCLSFTLQSDDEQDNAYTSETVENTEPEMSTTSEPQNKEIKISFLGDCMLASYRGENFPKNMNWCLDNYDPSYFFEKCLRYISADDFTVANCECVLSDTAKSEVHKNHSPAYWYRSGSKTANIFSASSINAVSIANNHIFDYGAQGKEDTKKALENAGVLWGNDDKSVILEKDGIKIGLLLVNFWSSYQADPIVSKIIKLSKTTDLQVVYFHGGTERIHHPEQWKIDGAHSFIEAGADLVLGGHPHVLQPYEQYNGIDIIYSMGNFCYGGSTHPENRTIIFQETFTFNSNNSLISTSNEIIPCYVYTGSSNNWQPCPIENEQEKEAVLSFMHGKTDSPF